MKALLISFVITTAWALMSDMEPQCYSRFDYEYKVVQKLFELEHGRNEQEAINKALEIKYENAKITTEERIRVLETENEQLKVVLDEMKILTEGLTKNVQTLKSQLEEMIGASSQLTISCQEKTTGFNSDGGGDSRYLDRQHVRCDQQQFLSNFRLERNGTNRKQIRYKYTCCSVI